VAQSRFLHLSIACRCRQRSVQSQPVAASSQVTSWPVVHALLHAATDLAG